MHGTKDYGNVSPKETTYRLDDMAELAVRLNALQSLDRLGDIMFKEDFSDGIYAWTLVTSGLGSSISLSTVNFRNSGFAVKLVGGSDESCIAQINMSFPFPVISSFGLECCMTIGDDVALIELEFMISSGGNNYYAHIYIDPVDHEITYLNGAGEFEVLLSGVEFFTDDYIYNSFKLVMDLINKKYKRFCYNSGVVTMEGFPLYSYPFGEPDYMTIYFIVTSKEGYNGVSYLDNVIVTQNEP